MASHSLVEGNQLASSFAKAANGYAFTGTTRQSRDEESLRVATAARSAPRRQQTHELLIQAKLRNHLFESLRGRDEVAAKSVAIESDL